MTNWARKPTCSTVPAPGRWWSPCRPSRSPCSAGRRATLAPSRGGPKGWQPTPPQPVPRLFYVTPACQHPLGVTMRMEQRLRLLEIAERSDAWVIEDDFDGEYRFQGRPIPAMQGAD